MRTTFVGLRVPYHAIAPLVQGFAEDTPQLIPATGDTVTLLASYAGALLRRPWARRSASGWCNRASEPYLQR
jgi:hypothetical protein